MRTLPLFALCALTCCGLLSAQESTQQLRDVHRIYVDSFGTEDGAEAIRSKIVTDLGKDRHLEIVPSAGEADAVLSGATQISKGPRRGPNGQIVSPPGGRFQAAVDVRLVGKDQKIIWTDDPSIRAPSHFGATSAAANRIVKDLLKAISKDAKSK